VNAYAPYCRLWPLSYSSSSMALLSNADLCLLYGLLPISSVFDLPFCSEATAFFFCGDMLSACRPTPNMEDKPIVFITPGAGQSGPATPTGTGYSFWSPFTTCMGCSETVLFPGHHTGTVASIPQKSFPRYLINNKIFGKKILLNIKCEFRFYQQLLSETFHTQRRNERDVIKNMYWSSCKVPLFWSDFNET